MVILLLWACNLPTSSTIFSIGSDGGLPPSNKSFPPILSSTISGLDMVASISSILASTSSDSKPPEPS